MIQKFIKKPIPIEAVQWTGNNIYEIRHFSNGNANENSDGYLTVKTLEGTFKSPNKTGDFLIKGIKGEFYICEKSIFEDTYMEYDEDRSYACAQMMF